MVQKVISWLLSFWKAKLQLWLCLVLGVRMRAGCIPPSPPSRGEWRDVSRAFFQESILSVLPQEGLRMLLLFDKKARMEAVTISAFIFILFGLAFTLLFVIIQASRPENNTQNQILICTSTKTPLHPEPAWSSSCRGKWWWDIVTGHRTKTAQWQKAIPLAKSWTLLPVSQLQLASNVQHPDLCQLQHNNRNAHYNLLLGIKISHIIIGFILTVHPSV